MLSLPLHLFQVWDHSLLPWFLLVFPKIKVYGNEEDFADNIFRLRVWVLRENFRDNFMDTLRNNLRDNFMFKVGDNLWQEGQFKKQVGTYFHSFLVWSNKQQTWNWIIIFTIQSQLYFCNFRSNLDKSLQVTTFCFFCQLRPGFEFVIFCYDIETDGTFYCCHFDFLPFYHPLNFQNHFHSNQQALA